jgi:hypothetical protein
MWPAVPCRLGQPSRDLESARRRRPIRIWERAHGRGQELALRPEDNRPEDRVDITTEDLRGDLRIRRAAAIREQARVIGLRRRLRIDSKTLAEPHRDPRCVQAMLERKAHRDVRRQAQRRRHLGGAHVPPAAQLLVRHVATLPEPAEGRPRRSHDSVSGDRPPGANWVPGDANAPADCAHKKGLQGRPFWKRLKGFEPSTFCMASRTCVSCSAQISPANGMVLVCRWRDPIPRLSPRVHGDLGTQWAPAGSPNGRSERTRSTIGPEPAYCRGSSSRRVSMPIHRPDSAAVRMRAAAAAVRRVCTQTRRVPWTRPLEASSCPPWCWFYFANTRSATLASARVSNATSLPPPL